MSITKAVIPAAGLGTRLNPITQIIPKELLPVVAKPSLHFVIEEAYASGLKEIILIVSPEKKEAFKHLKTFFPEITFQFIVQEKPLGLGHAVLVAEKAVGSEPFVVLLPDVLIDHPKPVSLQLLEIFKKIKKSVNATQHVPKEEIASYGVYEMTSSEKKLHLAKSVIEKPSPEKAPSDLGVIGRYLFTAEIFSILKNTLPGCNGEIQLADAMNTLAKQGGLYAYEFEGTHFDIGNRVGLLRANIYYGMKEYGKHIYKGLL